MGSRVKNKPLEDSVRWATVSLLPLGHPGIASTAKAAGCSVRTLQRRLSKDGLTYRRVVDEVRFEQAHRLLGDDTLRLFDITYQLGFTDAGSFSRAFRRWSGVTPRSYRCRLLGGRRPNGRPGRISRPIAPARSIPGRPNRG